MKTYPLDFQAGETKQLELSGNFFYLRQTTAPVTVMLRRRTKPASEIAINVEAGYYDRPIDGFDRVEITSATTQSIKIDLTTGNAGYDRGIASIVGDVNQAGTRYGSVSQAIGGTGALVTLLAPGANVNGAVVGLTSFSATGKWQGAAGVALMMAGIYADDVSTNYASAKIMLHYQVVSKYMATVNDREQFAAFTENLNQYIPPGFGIYCQSATLANMDQVSVALNYRLL